MYKRGHQRVAAYWIKSAVCIVLFSSPAAVWGWGFAAHKKINTCAIYTLPPAMFSFYKYYIQLVAEKAVDPDKRRYVVAGEAPKHYIDLDYYQAGWPLPWNWHRMVAVYPQEVVMAHGTLPWHISYVQQQLTEAFRKKEVTQIIKLSAEIGHYIADAHVPLHTTENYNGQFTNQEGIHRLWETQLPALFGAHYDLFVGQAIYVAHPQQRIWDTILASHQAVESVLRLEKELTASFSTIQKYCFEKTGSLLKVYAHDYARAYHTALGGQVEQRMRAAIKMIGDFWLTCWVDAGSYDLGELLNVPLQQGLLAVPVVSPDKLSVRDCGEKFP